MGCFEKVLGSLLGLFLVVCGVYGMITGAYVQAQGVFFIIIGGAFTLLNLITNAEDFQSFWESIFQSVFAAVIGKWAVLAGISVCLGYVVCLFIYGSGFLSL